MLVFQAQDQRLSRRCPPHRSDSVIHVETDGIYFPTRDYAEFERNLGQYSGAYPCNLGDALGSVKREHTSTGESYWLGKKF